MNRHEQYMYSKPSATNVAKFPIVFRNRSSVLIEYQYGHNNERYYSDSGMNCFQADPFKRYWWVNIVGETSRAREDPEHENTLTIEDCYEQI